MRRPRGFTLIEVMVVVAIIGILSVLFISLSARTFGSNADSIADQVSANLNFAHTRAVSTRRWHCVEVKAQQITLYQAKNSGMVQPAPGCPDNTQWQQIQTMFVPVGSTLWAYSTAPVTTLGAPPGQMAGMDWFGLLFKPDGSSTGGTIWITDTSGTRQDRVLIYGATGDVFPRKKW